MSQPQLQPPQWLHCTEGATQTAPMPTASHTTFKLRTLPKILLCPTPQAPCCSQADFKSFQTLLTPPMAPHTPSGLTPLFAAATLCPSSSISGSHSMICPPGPQCPPHHPPVWPRAAGGRRRRRWIQQTRPFKKQDKTEAAARAALPQAGAAPAQPREGRAGPGPAQRSSRDGSRHRHSARWAQAQGSHGVLHHGLKLERKHTAVSPCLQHSENPHHPPGTWDGG